MDQTQLAVLIGVGVLLVLLLAGLLLIRGGRRRRDHEALRQRFGPEYDRTVAATGSQKAAAADLHARDEERTHLDLQDLSATQRRELGAALAGAQYTFAEEPNAAMLEVARITTEALRARGYPVAGAREQSLRLLAVDHPHAAQPVRRALEAGYGNDADHQRRTLLEVRDALKEIAGISYGPDDIASDAQPSVSGVASAAPASSQAGSGDPTAGRPHDAPAPPLGARAAADRGALPTAPGTVDASPDDERDVLPSAPRTDPADDGRVVVVSHDEAATGTPDVQPHPSYTGEDPGDDPDLALPEPPRDQRS